MWRAGRYGLEERLISPVTLTPRPAAEVVGELMGFVRDGLAIHGDAELVEDVVDRMLAKGNGAQRQRAAHERHHDLRDVVDEVLI